MIIAPGSTSQSIVVQVVDDSGIAVTGLVAATMPAITYIKAGAFAAVSITLVDLALITTPYSSGGVKEISAGYYRLDLPIAVVSTAARVNLIGDAVDKHLIAPPLDVQITAVNVASTSQSAITNLSFAANAIEGAAIAADAITEAKISSGAENAIADALLDRAAGVETGLTLRQWLRLGAAALFGKTTNGQKTFRDINDTKDRIVATLESDGDRTVVTRDAT